MVMQKYKEVILKMDGEEFTRFYRTLLAELKINRHASCELQMWAVMTANEERVMEVLALMGKEVTT